MGYIRYFPIERLIAIARAMQFQYRAQCKIGDVQPTAIARM